MRTWVYTTLRIVAVAVLGLVAISGSAAAGVLRSNGARTPTGVVGWG